MKMTDFCRRVEKFVKTYPTPLAAGLTVLLIIAGVWHVASRPNQRVIGAMDNLAQLTENIRRNYKNRPDYWGLSTENVIQKQIAPSAMLRDGRLTSPVAAEISVGGDENGSMVMPGMRSFYIAFKNLSKKDCVDMAVYPLSEKIKLGLLSVTLKNGDEETVFQWGGENALLVSKEKAAKICRKKSIILWNFE